MEFLDVTRSVSRPSNAVAADKTAFSGSLSLISPLARPSPRCKTTSAASRYW